jgi:predicted RNA-binding Zn ribbon-like protein
MVTGEGLAGGTASVQPGGRPPAPGELALVQAFVNSHFDLEDDWGADLFATPERLAAWLSGHGLLRARTAVRPREQTRAVAVREGLRHLAAANNGVPAPASRSTGPVTLDELNTAAGGAAVEVRLRADGPTFVPTGAGLDRALGVLLAITASAMIDGAWRRLKVCPGDHCGWAFYDHSRNQTGRWCSMSVCGGRAKARTHYHRRSEEDRG